MSGVKLNISGSIHLVANVLSRGIQCSLMCLAAPVVSLLWIAVDHEHNG